MVKAKIIGTAPQLLVKDVMKTVDFYQKKLEFEVIGLVGKPVIYGMVQRDGFQIHFAQSKGGITKSNRELSSISHDYILWVPEIDSFYEELKNQKINIIEEIKLRPYGSREFVFEDIDGHIVLVGD